MSSKKNYYCAIDLGTTNTTLAFGMVNPKTGKLEAKCMKLKMKMAEGGVGKKDVVPSCVLVDINEAGEIVPTVGPYAKHMNSIDPKSVVISTKSDMGKGREYQIKDKTLTPVDISSYILDFVLKNAKEYFHERLDDLVITVPASFDSEMRTDTINAAKKAGIKVCEDDGTERNILLDEPRAALHNFINSLDNGELPEAVIDINTPKNVLVYDLGGGTLDVSLHKVWRNENGDVKFEDYAISLHTLVGGDNFDELFSQYLYEQIENKIVNISDDEKQRCMSKLRILAENAKIDMTNQFFDNQMMELDNEIEMEITQANIHDSVGIDELVTEEEYEEIVSSLMANELTLNSVDELEAGAIIESENIIYPILDVLLKANEKAGEKVSVDAVLLNGGMTKLPIIQKRLERFFGVKPISLQDPDLSVALGGVYYHYNLHNGIQPKRIQNDTIGIETNGGVEHLVKAGVTLPYKSKVYDIFSIPRDGVNRIDIPFYLGNRTDTLSPNRKIADRSVRYEKALKKDDTVSMQVEVNSAGILITTVWVNGVPSSKKIMEVDSKRAELNEYMDKVLAEDPNLKYRFTKETKSKEIYVDTDENVVKQSIIKEMKKFCTQYEKTNNPGLKKSFIDQVKNIESKIKQCTNKNEMAKVLSLEIQDLNNDYFFKSRLCQVYGELIKVVKLDDSMIRYATSQVSSLQYSIHLGNQQKVYLRALIEALAKSRDERLEPIFLKALKMKNDLNKASIITSLGKVGSTLDAFDDVYDYMSENRYESPEIFWALGKIGSREKKEALEIESIEYCIKYILDVVETGAEKVLSPYHALYALAEICDRRSGYNCIDQVKANKMIRAIKKSELKDYTAAVQVTQFNQMKEIAISVIKGEKLTAEQERCLLDVRTKLN